jgi:hypothetical protein
VYYDRFINNRVFEWMSESLGYTIKPDPVIVDRLFGTLLKTPRDILQFVGTEIMRAHHPGYHLEVCLQNINRKDNNVICDIRFPNEVAAVVVGGGYCVKINRKTSLCSDKNLSHASEVSLDGFDDWFYTMDNNREGLHFLYEEVEKLLQEIKNVRR